MYDPVKNAAMAKIIKDEQGWGAWYGAPEDLRQGKYADIPASGKSKDLRTRNIELAFGLPEGSYVKGMDIGQDVIDKAYRSNDPNMIKLIQEEGYQKTLEPVSVPSITSNTVPGLKINQPQQSPGLSWNPPKFELPKINIPQTAQRVTSDIKNYFTPTSNAGQNFWSTPVASGLANVQRAVQSVTQPVVNRVSQAVNTAKSWVSNLFKRK